MKNSFDIEAENCDVTCHEDKCTNLLDEIKSQPIVANLGNFSNELNYLKENEKLNSKNLKELIRFNKLLPKSLD